MRRRERAVLIITYKDGSFYIPWFHLTSRENFRALCLRCPQKLLPRENPAAVVSRCAAPTRISAALALCASPCTRYLSASRNRLLILYSPPEHLSSDTKLIAVILRRRGYFPVFGSWAARRSMRVFMRFTSTKTTNSRQAMATHIAIPLPSKGMTPLPR